jgi:Uma2 family endonuclease
MSMLLTEAPTDLFHLHRMTVDQFERMAEADLIPREDRVELINGVLVDMSPLGDAHVVVVAKLHYELGRRLDGRAVIFDQSSLRCGDRSEPEPDLVVARWPFDPYYERLPTADDALLVVEVADSSLRYDRKVKVPLYGRLGIPEVWVVDLVDRRVHVHTEPTGDGYTTVTTLTSNDVLVPTAFPDVQLPVHDLGLERLR